MVNLGALNWFDSFIKKLGKKPFYFIMHVIYTCEVGIKASQYQDIDTNTDTLGQYQNKISIPTIFVPL